VRDARVHAALLSVQVMFGTLPLAGQVAMEHISPMGLATMRIAGAALVLGLVAGRRLGSIRRSDLPWLALYAALGVVGNQVLFLMGLARSTQINASILITSIPVFTVAFALALRKEKASARRIAGVAVGLVGALLITHVERLDLSDATVAGNLMILVNAAFWSLHLVLARRLLERLDSLVVLAWMFILGAIPMLLLGGGDVVAAVGVATRRSWAAAAWAVAVPTVLSYLVNMWALRRVQASSVAIYVYLQPVVAGALAVLVAGERFTLRTGISAVLIFAGVALVQRWKRN
jgi:drug/metabolite transporter (DMT)-like permease